MGIRLLGSVEIAQPGGPAAVVTGARERLLLCLLAVSEAGVSTDRLVDEIWRESPPQNPANVLRNVVLRLRKSLAGQAVSVAGTAGGYRLVADDDDVDMRQFARLVREGDQALRAGDAPWARTHLSAALALWRGPAFADLTDHPALSVAAGALELQRLGAEELLGEARLQLGEHVGAVPDLERLVALHPFRERLWGLLILALYRCGRQTDALAAFRRCRAVLRDEAGLEPGRELHALEEAVLLQKPELDWTRKPDPAVAPAGRGGRLPTPLSSFVGRRAERGHLAVLLRTNRLVTALGPGGIGKTRLALAVAAELGEEFRDGIYFVDLVAVSDPGGVAAAVAAAAGVSERPGRTGPDAFEEALVAAFEHARALLILDNCEHVSVGVVSLAERLLPTAGRVAVLATSRSRLLVPGEVVYSLHGLSLPAANEMGDAVVLFADRAAAAGATPLTGTDHELVGDLCVRLDGMPLAIEIAAARAPQLGLPALIQAVADQLSVLTTGRAEGHRQQSLRAVLEWSYRLLTPLQQAVLRRLAVFAGPFTSSAAEQVVAFASVPPHDVSAALAALADQTLLYLVGGNRARMLEPLRQYCHELLVDEGELDEVLDRHLAWCVGEAEKLWDPRTAVVSEDAFDPVAADLRAALSWSQQQSGRRETARSLAESLADLAFGQGLLGESLDHYRTASGLSDGARSADPLRLASRVALCRQDGSGAFDLLVRCAGIEQEQGDPVRAARDLAEAAMYRVRFAGHFADSIPDGEVRAMLRRATSWAPDDPAVRATALVVTSYLDPDVRSASATATLAVEVAGAADPVVESAALDSFAAVSRATFRMDAAAAADQRSIDLLRNERLDARTGQEFFDALRNQAEDRLNAGDFAGARQSTMTQDRLPFIRQERHGLMNFLMIAGALADDWDSVLAAGAQYRAQWARAGRPHSAWLGRGPAAAAMVCAIRGDEAAARDWTALADEHGIAALRADGKGFGLSEVFAVVALAHRGELSAAMALVDSTCETSPYSTLDRHPLIWQYSSFADVAALVGDASAPERIARAREQLRPGNHVAEAFITRAEGLRTRSRESVLAAARMFDAAGCAYQHGRSLILAGGAEGAAGVAVLRAIGATPMALPV